MLFEHASTAHTGLFHSVGGTAFTAPNTVLFEAVRVTGHDGEWLKAVFHVGTMPPCCRGPDGDANTPYNRTCGTTTSAWLQPGPGKPDPSSRSLARSLTSTLATYCAYFYLLIHNFEPGPCLPKRRVAEGKDCFMFRLLNPPGISSHARGHKYGTSIHSC